MTPTQRLHVSKLKQHVHHLTTTTTGITQPRQSPITDIRTLTRIVLESYQASYLHSSLKVQRRYQKLIRDLADHAKGRERGHPEAHCCHGHVCLRKTGRERCPDARLLSS